MDNIIKNCKMLSGATENELQKLPSPFICSYGKSNRTYMYVFDKISIIQTWLKK